MSDRDSGVDSAGEDSNLPGMLGGNPLNNNEDFQDDDVEDMNDDVDDDVEDRPAINDNYAELPVEGIVYQIAPINQENPIQSNQLNHNDEIVFLNNTMKNVSINEPSLFKSREQLMMTIPSTSQQQPLDLLTRPSTSSSSFLNCNPNTSSNSTTPDDATDRNGLHMKTTTSTNETIGGDDSSVESPRIMNSLIANVNLCGYNITFKSNELNALWEFYQPNKGQHYLVPKMKISKKSRVHRSNFNEYFNHRLLRYCPSSSHIRNRTVFLSPEEKLSDEKLLRSSAINGDVELLNRLIFNQHVDVNACDEIKRTALHFAAVRGHNEIARILLENGADPNLKDVVGNTPLHLAVCSSKLDMVIILLKNGANCAQSDNNGRTPVQLACSKLRYLFKDDSTPSSLSTSSSSSSTNQNVSSSAHTTLMSMSNTICDNNHDLKSPMEKLKFEVRKISMMLGIYFEKMEPFTKQRQDMDAFKNRLEQSHTTEQIENDVNDLLKCLEQWAL